MTHSTGVYDINTKSKASQLFQWEPSPARLHTAKKLGKVPTVLVAFLPCAHVGLHTRTLLQCACMQHHVCTRPKREGRYLGLHRRHRSLQQREQRHRNKAGVVEASRRKKNMRAKRRGGLEQQCMHVSKRAFAHLLLLL